MSQKEIVYRSNARKALQRGVDALADVVKVTLGPRGRNVAIEKSWGAPLVTKDGVSVAKEIELGDKLENMGAQMVREVASRTNDDTGDGTTTATVLAQSLFNGGLKLVEAGIAVMELKRGIDKAVEVVTADLKKQAKKAKDSNGHPAHRHGQRQRRRGHRPDARRRHGQGDARRRDHGGRGQGHRDRGRGRRGHAVRPRLSLAVLRDRSEAHDGRARQRVSARHRQEGLGHGGHRRRARRR